MDIQEFINKAKIIHGERYIYDKSIFINSNSKIIIECIIHGVFYQEPDIHLSGCGCRYCGYDSSAEKKREKNIINKFNDKWNHFYDYSLVEYVNNKEYIIIICPIHGEFLQNSKNHLNFGCSGCSGNKKLTIDSFNEKAKIIHGDKYLYCFPEIFNTNTIIDIKCPKHGIFKKRINNHLYNKQGCPMCKESKGESIIKKILSDNNIIFKPQKEFEGCKNIRNLKFDFYLPEKNICIEFDGLQHSKPIELFGGKNYLEYVRKNDNIKNEYCRINNIRLIRIDKLSNIYNILKEFIN